MHGTVPCSPGGPPAAHNWPLRKWQSSKARRWYKAVCHCRNLASVQVAELQSKQQELQLQEVELRKSQTLAAIDEQQGAVQDAMTKVPSRVVLS